MLHEMHALKELMLSSSNKLWFNVLIFHIQKHIPHFPSWEPLSQEVTVTLPRS